VSWYIAFTGNDSPDVEKVKKWKKSLQVSFRKAVHEATAAMGERSVPVKSEEAVDQPLIKMENAEEAPTDSSTTSSSSTPIRQEFQSSTAIIGTKKSRLTVIKKEHIHVVTPQLSEYERERAERVRKNMEMIESLGLNNARAAMHEAKLAHSRAGTGTGRGLKPKKDRPRSAVDPSSQRRSGRIKGEKADGMFVDHEGRGGKCVIGIQEDDGKTKIVLPDRSMVVQEFDRRFRHTDAVLTLESTGGTEEYGPHFLQSLQALCNGEKVTMEKCPISSDVMEYAARMSKLRINEHGVAKVTPSRIYGIDVHPSPHNLLIACGDKEGNLDLSCLV
jgi:hypothetical protein